MTRVPLQLWDSMLMAEERPAAIPEVEGKIESGQLTWSDVGSLIQHPENPGLILEGIKLEGAQDGNHSWLHGPDKAIQEANLVDLRHLDRPVQDLARVDALPEDDPLEVVEAEVLTNRLASLRLRAAALEASMPVSWFHADSEISRLRRGLRSKTGKDKSGNSVFRRHVNKIL